MNNILPEIKETLRKIGWQLIIGNSTDNRRIKFNKKTPLPDKKTYWFNSMCTNIFEELKNIAIQQSNEYSTNCILLSKKIWLKIFEYIKPHGKLMQCDKNLGVKFITNNMYTKLADKECKKYIVKPYTHKDEHDILHKEFQLLMYVYNRLLSKTPYCFVTYENELKEYIVHDVKNKHCFLPKLRLLLKIHKAQCESLYQTRPIIPTCSLPTYILSKWAGEVLAIVQNKIPWILQDTNQFLNWLTSGSLSQNIKTFDFTNLYGNEPVKETLNLLKEAIIHLPFTINKDEQEMWNTCMKLIDTPHELKHLITDNRTTILLLSACITIRHTYAICELNDTQNVILYTDKFLAMGSCPVAPISNITLAYLEYKKLGNKVFKGMRRLIDDITIDLSVITENELRSCYPQYLQLNEADNDHFLDVNMWFDSIQWQHSPYIKPFNIIPLNWDSGHTLHTKKAIALNELLRLCKLCSVKEERLIWTEFWYNKFIKANYPTNVLLKIIQKVTLSGKKNRSQQPNNFWHVETWYNTDIRTADIISKHTNTNVKTAWKGSKALNALAYDTCCNIEKQRIQDCKKYGHHIFNVAMNTTLNQTTPFNRNRFIY